MRATRAKEPIPPLHRKSSVASSSSSTASKPPIQAKAPPPAPPRSLPSKKVSAKGKSKGPAPQTSSAPPPPSTAPSAKPGKSVPPQPSSEKVDLNNSQQSTPGSTRLSRSPTTPGSHPPTPLFAPPTFNLDDKAKRRRSRAKSLGDAARPFPLLLHANKSPKPTPQPSPPDPPLHATLPAPSVVAPGSRPVSPPQAASTLQPQTTSTPQGPDSPRTAGVHSKTTGAISSLPDKGPAGNDKAESTGGGKDAAEADTSHKSSASNNDKKEDKRETGGSAEQTDSPGPQPEGEGGGAEPAKEEVKGGVGEGVKEGMGEEVKGGVVEEAKPEPKRVTLEGIATVINTTAIESEEVTGEDGEGETGEAMTEPATEGLEQPWEDRVEEEEVEEDGMENEPPSSGSPAMSPRHSHDSTTYSKRTSLQDFASSKASQSDAEQSQSRLRKNIIVSSGLPGRSRTAVVEVRGDSRRDELIEAVKERLGLMMGSTVDMELRRGGHAVPIDFKGVEERGCYHLVPRIPSRTPSSPSRTPSPDLPGVPSQRSMDSSSGRRCPPAHSIATGIKESHIYGERTVENVGPYPAADDLGHTVQRPTTPPRTPTSATFLHSYRSVTVDRPQAQQSSMESIFRTLLAEERGRRGLPQDVGARGRPVVTPPATPHTVPQPLQQAHNFIPPPDPQQPRHPNPRVEQPTPTPHAPEYRAQRHPHYPAPSDPTHEVGWRHYRQHHLTSNREVSYQPIPSQAPPLSTAPRRACLSPPPPPPTVSAPPPPPMVSVPPKHRNILSPRVGQAVPPQHPSKWSFSLPTDTVERPVDIMPSTSTLPDTRRTSPARAGPWMAWSLSR